MSLKANNFQRLLFLTSKTRDIFVGPWRTSVPAAANAAPGLVLPAKPSRWRVGCSTRLFHTYLAEVELVEVELAILELAILELAEVELAGVELALRLCFFFFLPLKRGA